MLHNSTSLKRLVGELKKLPGVGEKTACRLAFHLLRFPENMTALSESLRDVADKVRFCSTCFMITEDDPCWLCTGNRDSSLLCVVEEPQDVMSIERSGAFKGRYHVLHGALSPLNGITPANLKIAELVDRIEENGIREVVIATNFSVEGEATALYLTGLLKKHQVRISRLAYGIPVGSDLEYVDAATMLRALEGRSEL
jgi:recombination protein RecR